MLARAMITFFFFSSRRRHTRSKRDWSSDVCSSDLDTVFVIGAGPTGIACLLQAKQRGAKVFISDFNQNRLDYAKSIGADAVIQPDEVDVYEKIRKLTDGELANVVIDAVGLPQTFQQAVELASIAGRVVTLGFNEQPSSIPSLLLTKKELKVVGSRLQTHQFPK